MFFRVAFREGELIA